MTKQDVEKFKKMLLKKRALILQDANYLAGEALHKTRDDAATLDISNFADLGSDNFEQELELDLLEGHEKVLADVNEALQRIEDGTFGECESCGKAIRKVRLKAMPHAKMCLECKRNDELNNGEEI